MYGPRWPVQLELDLRQVEIVRPAPAAASAIARSWIARPVESKAVISAASRRPTADPASTAPRSVTSLAGERALLDRVHELAVVARLRPVVTEDAAAHELGDGDLGLARPVGAHQAHVLARRAAFPPGARSRGRASRSRPRRRRAHPASDRRDVRSRARSRRPRPAPGRRRRSRRSWPRARKVRAAARPLTPAPITAAVFAVGPTERLRGEHSGRAGAQRGDGCPRRARPPARRSTRPRAARAPSRSAAPARGCPGTR